MNHNPIVSREEWLTARKLLLTREKELTRARDELSRQRRELPWVKIDKPYEFDSPTGKVTLARLFNGRSQLFIKHFMMGPGAAHQCVGCSLEVDHVEGLLEHLENHDVTYTAVARAPIEEIEAVRKRMGWRFPWVSSYHSDFNYDFNVSFTAEQVASGRALYNFERAPEWAAGLEDLSGDSVFYNDESARDLKSRAHAPISIDFSAMSLTLKTEVWMTQSDANSSLSTSQPVDTQAAVDKAAVDASLARTHRKSRTMFLRTGCNIFRSYLLPAFRRFDSRQDARLPQLLQK